MELPKGLYWREKPSGKESKTKQTDKSYYPSIYFNTMHRVRRLRGSSRTSSSREAGKRLDLWKRQIDDVAVYGMRPKRTFREAAAYHLKTEVNKKALVDDVHHLNSLMPFIGGKYIDEIFNDTLTPWKAHRRKTVKTKTINLGVQVANKILRKCAREWVHEGMTWLAQAPYLKQDKIEDAAQPYPLSRGEQNRLFTELPLHLAQMAVFKVNTGCREQEVCNLRWGWEEYSEELGETIFRIPGTFEAIDDDGEVVRIKLTKNRKVHIVVLNRAARLVIEALRGRRDDYVFEPVKKMNNTGWKSAWKRAGLPVGREYVKGVHNLKHTFGGRLRALGVPEWDVQMLLHHMPKKGDVTQLYAKLGLLTIKKHLDKLEAPKSNVTYLPQRAFG